MSTWHGDPANRQQEVYNSRGQVVGGIAFDGGNWLAVSLDGRRQETCRTRREAEQTVLGWDRGIASMQRRPAAPSAPQAATVSLEQVTGALVAGAALMGAIGAFLGQQEQPRGNDQADELRRQNEALREQNELLKAALGRLGPAPLARRK